MPNFQVGDRVRLEGVVTEVYMAGNVEILLDGNELSGLFATKTMRHATLVHPKEEKAEFEECDTCKVKPGSPDLCQGCVRNRLLIERLSKAEVKKGRWELRSETIDKEIEQFLDVGWEPFQCVHIDGELIVYLKRFIPVE